MFEKLSKKIGFTNLEIKVILFLILGFLTGFIIKLFQDSTVPERKLFDYTQEDSLFDHYRTVAKNKRKSVLNDKDSSIADIRSEVIDLNQTIFEKKKIKQLPADHSIEINSASVEQMISLPGIGDKTARLIIELRNERGNFEQLDELKDVKGIGEVKFNKIKKFLYIK